jgi:UDP-2,4-diacetamido-2,4,6-trideoxy-beta-L-altropyranose hydrolase
MNVLIRVDSSEQIGSGHIVRCLTLAEKLREYGADVFFLSCELPGNALELVRRTGFPALTLASSMMTTENAGPTWFFGKSWQADAAECVALTQHMERGVDWLIVDHYGIDSRWEMLLRPHVGHIAVIDDLADRKHECDVLLDQNFHLDPLQRYKGLLPQACVTLLGPRFALIRPEFVEIRARERSRDGRIQRVLVALGGTDSGHETYRTVAAIMNLERPVHIDVVVGQSYSRFDELEQLCCQAGHVSLYRQPAHLATLMNGADIAIGAGGITTWERCCLRLPSIVMAIAANQEPSMRAMEAAKILVYLGRAREVTDNRIREALLRFMDDSQEVRRLSVAAGKLVDGKGCELVTSEILNDRNGLSRKIPGSAEG